MMRLLKDTPRDVKYRDSLGYYICQEIKLQCNDFELKIREDGEKFLLLRKPEVIKIIGKKDSHPYPTLHHLWIKIPKEFEKWLPIARKIEIKGVIKEYYYKDKNTKQVGVCVSEIRIVKYKKQIAKKYGLAPGQTLSIYQMEKIIKEMEAVS